jgi:puromycin-sensitive aminopeptidase
MFDFEEELTKDGSLFLKFNGTLNDQMSGFYRSKYINAKGEEKYIATTQFESTDARRCFPCWDEPSLKSVFEVTLVVPEDRIAISNMDCTSGNSLVSEGSSSEKKKIVKFSPSPIMSTYLLAFIVGEFDYVEGKTPEGLPVRCFVPLGKKEQGLFGLDIAIKVIPLFEEYFGEKYPLPKLDLIAIPDFAAGAMENWGLLTYRETALLYDPKQSSASIKQRVALVVAHECAHQWFGNLVTMEWWEQLWLNEGFATWVEYLAVDELFPDWNIFEQFVDGEYASAQRLDALEASHPIEVEVNSAMEIDEIFDGISYAKGCAVIRMLAEYVGLQTFKEALRYYLSNHKYSNASSKDLWDAVSKKSGKDIETLMNSWTRKMGFPLVEIKQKISNGKRIVSVKQHRYLSSGFKEDDSLWHIPLGYVTSDNSTPVFTLLTEKESTIEIDENVKWVKFNPSQTGFYRVLYPDSYYDELSLAIQSKKLSSIDRLGVQNDVCSLCASGFLKTSLALKIIRNYSNEDNFIVWNGVSGNLSAIWSLIKYESFSDSFSKLPQQLYKPLGEKLGWDAKKGETHLDALLRSLMISQLGACDDEDTIKIAKEKFPLFIKDNSVVAPDLRSAFYQIIFKHGGEEAYEELLKIFKTTTLNEERVRILGAIGNVPDEKKLQEVLTWGWSDAVKRQDTFYLFSSVARNKKGRDLTWKFFVDNYDEMVSRYSVKITFLTHVLEWIEFH